MLSLINVCSLLTKPSEEVQQGRYYHKTLDQLDATTLVRDRSGHGLRHGAEGVDVEEEEEIAEEDEEPADEANEMRQGHDDMIVDEGGSAGSSAKLQKTDRQQALEAEWGLYRSPVLSQKSEEEDASDTDNERKRDSPEIGDEEFVVSIGALALRLRAPEAKLIRSRMRSIMTVMRA